MKILSTKLINAMKEKTSILNLSFDLHNVKINGPFIGCTGLIKNNDTGVCIYVDTTTPIGVTGYLYRYTTPDQPFGGRFNQFTNNKTLDALTTDLCNALKRDPARVQRYL